MIACMPFGRQSCSDEKYSVGDLYGRRGPNTATMDSPGGPLTAGDYPRHDTTHALPIVSTFISLWDGGQVEESSENGLERFTGPRP